MSSVLRQKLTARPAVSDETKGLTPLWDGFGRLVSRRLEQEELGAVLIKSTATRRMTFADYVADHAGEQAVFRMGSEETPVTCIAHASRELTAVICGGKLGDEDVSLDDYLPSTLDILLMQPIVSEFFDGFAQSCDGLEKSSPFNGAEYQGGMTAFSALELADENLPMLVLSFTLSIGANREADISFLMPYQPIEKLSTMLANTPSHAVDDPDDPWSGHMYGASMAARVTLMAVLERCTMSVAECARLQIGDVIALPGVSLNELSLEARSQYGHLSFATGALGVMKQFKAVKLMSDPPEEFIADFAEA